VELQIPPLRERRTDIIPLILHFVEQYQKRYGIKHSFAQDTLDILSAYFWPGNVRELSHLVERLVVTVGEDIITPQHLPEKILHCSDVINRDSVLNKLMPLQAAQDQVEKELIIRSYTELKSSYKVAKVLNISQSKAFRLIKKYVNRGEANTS
jgi:transcriptional regulator with PAS, ATPase and Fis domain